MMTPSSNETKCYPRDMFITLILGAFVLGCLNQPGEAVDPMRSAVVPVAFDQHEVVTGSAKQQTVLTGHLLGRAVAELVIINVDENDERHLHIYAFDKDGVYTLMFGFSNEKPFSLITGLRKKSKRTGRSMSHSKSCIPRSAG